MVNQMTTLIMFAIISQDSTTIQTNIRNQCMMIKGRWKHQIAVKRWIDLGLLAANIALFMRNLL